MTRELNLTTHRAPASVWDRRGWDGTREQLTLMRWLIGIGGGALAIQGMRQRSIVGTVLTGVGTSLAWWALTGEGDLSEARRSSRAARKARRTVRDSQADAQERHLRAARREKLDCSSEHHGRRAKAF